MTWSIEGSSQVALGASSADVDIGFDVTSNAVSFEIGVSSGGVPYSGSYTVTPRVSAQTLATKSRLMQDDVTVLAIPYEEVSNPQGGNTVTIGGY